MREKAPDRENDDVEDVFDEGPQLVSGKVAMKAATMIRSSRVPEQPAIKEAVFSD